MSSRESFQKAKIEHYLEQVHTCIASARYTAARRVMERVYALDPANPTCKSFEASIAGVMEDLRTRKNGAPQGQVVPHHIGEVGEPVRQEIIRRSEIVLVVDQDERVLQSLACSLRKQGYRSLGAATYEEALEILELLLPDVVVSEVNFAAGPRGMDLFMWMRNNTRTAGIPFLFYAARIDREILIAGKRFGVEDFILKPSDDEVVTASIQNALGRRKSSP